MAEFSKSLLELAQVPKDVKVIKRAIDEEKPLPFDSNSMDVVLSGLK